eukprot:NODE_4691_length_454_cov_148.945679_g4048_i0.p4 GENE.NODE_4691_length_454_cov_148.945679_g4048_i0~~NODE_4691_length_454_cov_148.945679_g4048_i0.p4  ORF type:complete len:53 (+),score=20.58 NODE_4691_length_454_cov_148.945679_g4048_i0:128-286(+)
MTCVDDDFSSCVWGCIVCGVISVLLVCVVHGVWCILLVFLCVVDHCGVHVVS